MGQGRRKARHRPDVALPPAPAPWARPGPAFLYQACSLAVLAPCVWQSRIQAGDLGSHIYNAWLAQLIGAGRAPGLRLARQSTNVLFDLMLEWLLAALGSGAAQRIAVGAAVLIFVWGAFAFAGRLAGRRPWELVPMLGMLVYGWVFHMGLFNFYLGLGLCFAALALAWDWQPRRLAVAVPLLVLGYAAHGLPVAWALAVLAYHGLAERLVPRHRLWLMGAALAAIVAARIALQAALAVQWKPDQILSAIAVQQFWVYGSRYLAPAAVVVGACFLLVGDGVRRKGLRSSLGDVPLQILLLTAAGILILPGYILLPQYHHALAYLADRMSLPLAVCLLAAAARAQASRYLGYAGAAAALLFGAFLWQDEGKLNALEDRMDSVVEHLPPGQRVVNGVRAADVPTIPTNHMIDRICVGRCYSYDNYEPSSGQFRVRVTGENPIVVATDADANGLLTGAYVVQARDLPLYQVTLDPRGQVGYRLLPAGARSGIALWEGL